MSLVATVIVVLFVLYAVTDPEDTTVSAPDVIEQTGGAEGASIKTKTNPEPETMGSGDAKGVENQAVQPVQKENAKRGTSKRNRRSQTRSTPSKEEKVTTDNGQGQAFNGSLSTETAASPNTNGDAQKEANDTNEAKDDWGIEEDIRDPWAGER